MSSYLIGNLIGRLLVSAFLVWIALLFINRFKFGLSAKKLIRPLPLLSTVLLFCMGLIGHAAANDNQTYAATFSSVGMKYTLSDVINTAGD